MKKQDPKLKELNEQAEIILETRRWWEEESMALLAESIEYMNQLDQLGEENITPAHVEVLKDYEAKMDYMERRGYFEFNASKEFEVKLTSYLTEQMWERWKKEN